MDSKKEQGTDRDEDEHRAHDIENRIMIGGQPAPSPAVRTIVNEKAHSNTAQTTSNSPANQTPDDDIIPDGGYGWAVVFSVTTINAFTWGVVTSYGIFLAYYLEHSLYPSATSLDYAFIGGLCFGLSLLVASPVTYITRTLGLHTPLVIGVVLQTTGFVAASFATKIWHLYLSQGICVGVGVGFLFIPSVAVTSQWFSRKRSLANSINSAGSGLGGIIISFATRPMIENLSLPWALRIIGIISGCMNLIATLVIRSRNGVVKPPMHPFDVRLLRKLDNVLLLGWGFFSMLGYITLIYSMSDFARSIGLSNSQASTITALLQLGAAIGRPIVGVLSDRFGRIRVAFLATFLNFVTIFAFWLPSQNYGLTIFFAIFNGGIVGVFWMTVSPLCAEVAGLRQLPSLLSLMWATLVLPTTFSEVVALKIRRPAANRPYLYPQIYCGLVYAVASACLAVLWMRQRRRKLVSPSI